jgi:hypothetical protein
MKSTISDAMELRDELENDLALAMLIERRHARKIGSEQARELIAKIKTVLSASNEENASDLPVQNLTNSAFH